ncbi:MAG: hypothetical protein IPJ52_12505 [Rhodocyclaceae bacterium]|nr:hypothetical protein [Rhodocyclaceae bacterium]
MSYPNYDIRIGATSVPDTGREFARATNGALRGRSFFTTSKRTFQITHVLTQAQLVAWRAYIAAMTTDTFVWPRDGLTYTVMLAGDPKETPLGGGVYTEVSLELREV